MKNDNIIYDNIKEHLKKRKFIIYGEIYQNKIYKVNMAMSLNKIKHKHLMIRKIRFH